MWISGVTSRLKKVVVDKGCMIPEGMAVGVDPEEDAKRFHVTEKGRYPGHPGNAGAADSSGSIIQLPNAMSPRANCGAGTPDLLQSMSPKKNSILILCWHMHQPDYRHHVTGEFALPWTYLHAIKDYTDMAYHLEQHPQVHGRW